MPLLRTAEYGRLAELALDHSEDEATRQLVLHDFNLPSGVYNVDACDLLVLIPPNYPDAGIDMFWTRPRLTRKDQKPIPQTSAPGDRHNRHFDGGEYCRWSRHWNTPQTRWRAGVDDIDSILRRLQWAFENSDADRK